MDKSNEERQHLELDITAQSNTPCVANVVKSNEERQHDNNKNDTNKKDTKIIFLCVKLCVRFVMLIYMVIIFGNYYWKCWKFMWRNQIVNDDFLTDYTKNISNNETVRLSIQFCSALFEDKHYLDENYSTLEKGILLWLKRIYCCFEVFFLLITALIPIKEKIQSTIKEKRPNGLFFKLCFHFFLIDILVVFFVFVVPYIVISLIFVGLNSWMNVRAFNIKRLIENFEEIITADTLFIQLFALFTMHTIKENFKLLDIKDGLPGVLVIKHSASIKKILGLSILGFLFSKFLSPIFNSLNTSDLPVRFFNCSSHTNCTNKPLTVKVYELSADIKSTFYIELTYYALDNTLINRIFPLFTFAYCLFFIFLIGHCIFEVSGCVKSDLKLARTKQHLIEYYSNNDNVSLKRLVRKGLDFISKLGEKKKNEQEDASATLLNRQGVSANEQEGVSANEQEGVSANEQEGVSANEQEGVSGPLSLIRTVSGPGVSGPLSLSPQVKPANEQESGCCNKDCCFAVINWITWKPYYFFYKKTFKKSRVDKALEKIKLRLELDQLGIIPIAQAERGQPRIEMRPQLSV
jgi:hypothetical protein